MHIVDSDMRLYFSVATAYFNIKYKNSINNHNQFYDWILYPSVRKNSDLILWNDYTLWICKFINKSGNFQMIILFKNYLWLDLRWSEFQRHFFPWVFNICLWSFQQTSLISLEESNGKEIMKIWLTNKSSKIMWNGIHLPIADQNFP